MAIVVLNVTQDVAPLPATLQASCAVVSQGGTNTSPNTGTFLTQLADLTPILAGSKSVASLSQSGGTATLTAAAPHGYTVGDTLTVVVGGATQAAYNGQFTITVTTGSAFTYSVPSGTASPATTSTALTFTDADVSELLAMATTWFAQGSSLGVYVLELGPGNPNDGVAALTAYLTANPNTDYTPGAAGYYYRYVVPREWDGNANFIAMLANYNADTALTYFNVTTTLATYALYSNLDKCACLMVESPSFGVYAANALTAITYSNGLVTATTTTAHGVVPGNWFTLSGTSPSGYNGIFQALAGTTGSTLVYALTSNPGAETVLGTLQISSFANPAIPVTEFSMASEAWSTTNYAPSATNKVGQTSYKTVVGVSPFPTQGHKALLAALKAANVNVIGTGAEGGISNTILLYGRGLDGRDLSYWFKVDWVQINLNINLSNAVINGSADGPNPLDYDQPGINTLYGVTVTTMNTAVAFGLALAPVTITAQPFASYVLQNPSNFLIGVYGGIAVAFTPQKGFSEIIVNVLVTDFPTGG